MSEQLPAARSAREKLSQACSLLDTIREDSPIADRIEAADEALEMATEAMKETAELAERVETAEKALVLLEEGQSKMADLLKQLQGSIPDPKPAKAAPATTTSKPAAPAPKPVTEGAPGGVAKPMPPPRPA